MAKAMKGKGSKFLNSFWDLASDDARARCLATKRIIMHVNEMQKKSEDEGVICSDGDYAIQRLVRGLSSSRDSARQGFSACLCQFLVSFPFVEVDNVMKMINDNTRVSLHCVHMITVLTLFNGLRYTYRFRLPCEVLKRETLCSDVFLDTWPSSGRESCLGIIPIS